MKRRLNLILLLTLVVMCATSCTVINAGVEVYYRTVYSNVPEYEILVLEHERRNDLFELEIDGKVYDSEISPYPWVPNKEHYQVIGTSNMYGLTIIYSTGSPWWYRIQNTDMGGAIALPNNYVSSDIPDEVMEVMMEKSWNEIEINDYVFFDSMKFIMLGYPINEEYNVSKLELCLRNPQEYSTNVSKYGDVDRTYTMRVTAENAELEGMSRDIHVVMYENSSEYFLSIPNVGENYMINIDEFTS